MKLNNFFRNKLLIKSKINFFSTVPNSKNQVYVWFSNTNPGLRIDDFKNRLFIKNTPTKIDFFDDKNPIYMYSGPRSSAVIVENGDLYTFGNGNWGILGHGDEKTVDLSAPKKVEFFSENKIKLKKVTSGEYHSLALSEDGNVYSWGFGGRKTLLSIFFPEVGALGHGNKNDIFLPKKIKFFEKNQIKIKDIACGIRHSVILTTDGQVYTWGRGEYGLLGNGNNHDSLSPVKNSYIEMYKSENPENEIIKIDCADEFSGALTKGGDLYVWGKNQSGQLGIGAGIGIDFAESEKFPTLVAKPKEIKFLDFACGENTMMLLDQNDLLYKTGRRIDYTPSVFQISHEIKAKIFLCGSNFYAIVDKDNRIFQWGEMFKSKNIEQTDSDMLMVKDKFFDGKEILQICGKFKLCGAIVKDKNN